MSTFYLLPSRPQLGERFAGYLSTMFPGLNWSRQAWGELAETLAGIASRQPDVFVVYREELPRDEETAAALADGFGASAGDEVIELRPDPAARELHVQRWRVGGSHAN